MQDEVLERAPRIQGLSVQELESRATLQHDLLEPFGLPKASPEPRFLVGSVGSKVVN